MSYLLDSVILIDHLNGIDEATEFLAQHQPECALSVITRAEVLAGYEPRPAEAVRRLLDAFPTHAVDAVVADRAATLRREHHWRLPDALQAAIAELASLKLVTRNTKDFPPERHGFVLVPYTLRAARRS